MTELVILVTGLAAAAGVCALLDKSTKENFGNIPSRTIKNMPEMKIENRYGADMFTVPPNWQANITPRFSNTQYGAYILYNVPDERHLAAPYSPMPCSGGRCGSNSQHGERHGHHHKSGSSHMPYTPLQAPMVYGGRPHSPKEHHHGHHGGGDYADYPLVMGGDVREGYAQSGMAAAVDRAEDLQESMARNKFVQDVGDGKFLVGGDGGGGSADLMVGDDVIPHDTQVYNYDRLVYAQKRSRLHGLGDPIRGDLPIVPIQGSWFRPSVAANIDLRQGAIATISGSDGATHRELRALQADVSGRSALAQKDISFDGRQSDITITAFP